LDKYDTFDEYLWQFTDGKVIKNQWKTIKQIPQGQKGI
jgi:3-methyladenine DNA glycosylase Tag